MLNKIIYKLKRPYHFIKTGLFNGLRAELKYKHPAKQLKIITITGTDGKTTSSTLLYHVLKTSQENHKTGKVALLSTVGAYLGNKPVSTGFHVTLPQPKDLQQFIKKMVDKNYQYLVLEVTSHGDYQHRTWGIKPILAGLTNVSNEHLDYHLTYNEYLKAKINILRKAPVAVVNADDKSYLYLIKQLKHTNLVTYSKDTQLPKKVDKAVRKKFIEDYNQMNAKLVYALAKSLKISDDDYIQAINSFSGIPGRMQRVKNNRKLDIIVDFAHTPQGLKAVLRSIKETRPQGKLISVFGCAGERDKNKRPVMGKIASELADLSIFTAEDPRSEDVWSIIREMKEQLTSNHDKIVSLADRGEAIEFAINNLAQANDTIVILGKGHEKSMNYHGVEYPWDDVQAIKQVLKGQHPRIK